jgi:hypothetical protein
MKILTAGSFETSVHPEYTLSLEPQIVFTFSCSSLSKRCPDGNRPLLYMIPHRLLCLLLLYQIAKMRLQGNGKECCSVFTSPCTVTVIHSDLSTLALCGLNMYKGNQVRSHNLIVYTKPHTYPS